MAKILVEFDTKAKTLSVKKDGTEMPNVVAVELARSDYYGYGYGGEGDDDEDFRFSLTQMESDKENDTRQMTRTVANSVGDLVIETGPEPDKTKEDLRATAQLRRISNKATADIAEYFKEGF